MMIQDQQLFGYNPSIIVIQNSNADGMLHPFLQGQLYTNTTTNPIITQIIIKSQFSTSNEMKKLPQNYTKSSVKRIIHTKSKPKDKSTKQNKNIRQKFSPEEDEKLKKLVESKGSKKWDAIAKEMPGRTGRQCRDRYKNYLIPGFFNGQWSKEEDQLLLQKYIEFGSQWSKIAQFFKNRSANSLKNRWNYFVSKHFEFTFNPASIAQFLENANANNIKKNDDGDINKSDERNIDESGDSNVSYNGALNYYIDPVFDIYDHFDPLCANDHFDILKDDNLDFS